MELHTMSSSRTSTSRLYASLHNLQMESFQNSERGLFSIVVLNFGFWTRAQDQTDGSNWLLRVDKNLGEMSKI